MTGIRSVGIVGAGALGVLYACAFQRAPDVQVFFIADGDRYRKLAARRFIVNGELRDIDVRRSGNKAALPDLLIVAVKNYHLGSVFPALHKVCAPGTAVVSVLNGIDSEPLISAEVPDATVLYTVAVGMDAVRAGDRVDYSTEGKLLMGTRGNDQGDPNLLAVSDAFRHAGVPVEIPADIHRAVWWKWMVNIGINQASAVTGASYGAFQRDADAQALMEAAMRETVRVARVEGIDLRERDIEDWYALLNSLGPDGRTSMLQDIAAGRKTEVDSFGGRLIELARSRRVPTPVNETLVRIITIRERIAGTRDDGG